MDTDDRRARFERLAHDVWQPLQRYVARRAAPDDVDDVVAETLTVLWRRLDDVPADAALPWTYATARRTLANHRRGARRRDGLRQRFASRTTTADVTTGPADAGDDGDPAVDRALARLGPDDAELLRLWAWEQLEPREIAVVLAASPNTISVRLGRARRRLGELLVADGHDRGAAGHNHLADPTEPTR